MGSTEELTTWQRVLIEFEKREAAKAKWWKQAKQKERAVLLGQYISQCG